MGMGQTQSNFNARGQKRKISGISNFLMDRETNSRVDRNKQRTELYDNYITRLIHDIYQYNINDNARIDDEKDILYAIRRYGYYIGKWKINQQLFKKYINA